MFKNLIYSCNCKTEFSAGFRICVTWSFRKSF